MALTTVKSDQIQTSVALAGSPTTTTQSASDNSTKVATTAYVETAVANLVASAPAALNTLDELAAALNDDASFSSSVTTSLAAKANLAAPNFTGNVTFDSTTLTVDASNNRVGIGTASPGASLELSSALTSAAGGALITNTNAAGYSAVQFKNTGGTPQTYTLALGGSTSAFAQKLYIYDDTDSAARVVLDHSGKVGIGTSSPDVPLDVEGAIQASESGGDFIRMQTDGTNNIFDINSGDYVFRTAGFAQRLRITSSGNVGIGEISPQGNLHVKSADSGATADGGANELVVEGSGNTGISILSGASSSGAMYFGDSGSAYDGYISYDQTNHRFSFATNSSPKVYIDTSGKVGIGTTSAPAGLPLQTKVSSGDNKLRMTTANKDAFILELKDASGDVHLGTNTTAGAIVIADGGNVGIGTTPGYKLTVVGESSLGDFNANGFANLGRNADGNQDVTTIGGYGVDAGSGTRYGRYGALRFRSSANYTSGSRGYMITNGYGANKFAIFQSSSATTMPSLGAYGSVTGGTAPFIMDNSGDITMGYQPYAHGVITGNITGPSADYGIALTTHASRNITPQTNSTHGPGITITKAGFYIMSMSFLQDPVGTYIYTGWCVNGSMVHHWHSNHAIANNHDAHSSIGKYLSVGDHVTIERTTANGITTIYGNTHSYWWICKIS